MANTSTGAARRLGAASMDRLTELRRQAVVMLSEVTGAEPGSGSVLPRLVEVVRRQQTAPGDLVAGIAPTYAEVAGLTGLTGHVRTQGQWASEEAGGERIEIGDSQRIVVILDIPAAGGIGAEQLLLTDRLRFDDPLVGGTVWRVTSVRVREADGIAVALVEHAKEEHV